LGWISALDVEGRTIACMLVCLDYIACCIVNAIHSGASFAVTRGETSERAMASLRMLAAMEHLNIPFGIYRNTAAFDQVLARRQLKEIWNCLVIEFGNACFRTDLRKRGIT
jgi:hypothetical protein